MLIKINNKPIEVKEESEESTFSPVYLTVSLTGYFFILYLLDYISIIFLGHSTLPIIKSIGDTIVYILQGGFI